MYINIIPILYGSLIICETHHSFLLCSVLSHISHLTRTTFDVIYNFLSFSSYLLSPIIIKVKFRVLLYVV